MNILDGAHVSVAPLTETRGKHHNCLGIPLSFSAINQAYVMSQYDFLKKLNMNILEELKGPGMNQGESEC